MIITRGLGRNGAARSLLVTSGIGRWIISEIITEIRHKYFKVHVKDGVTKNVYIT